MPHTIRGAGWRPISWTFHNLAGACARNHAWAKAAEVLRTDLEIGVELGGLVEMWLLSRT